jgi:transcription elongation factor GreA
MEADPVEGRISNESPLGKVLVGARLKDVVRVNAPRGITEFEIVKVE